MKKQMALAALFCAACNTDFTEAYEVDEPKLMGARIEVTGAPERAWPRVGESFTMRVLVARSSKKPSLPLGKQLDASISVCIGGKLPDGSLFCAAEIPLSAFPDLPPAKVVSFEEIAIPLTFGDADPRKLAGTSNVLLFGAVCVEGTVERVKGKVAGVDPANELFRCVDNKQAELQEPLAFTNTVTIDYPDDEFAANLNPSFACDSTDEGSICNAGTKNKGEETVGGAFVLVRPKEDDAKESVKRAVVAWPEVLAQPQKALDYTDCAEDPRFEALQVRVDSGEHLIRIRFAESSRETYKAERPRYNETIIVEQREELLISHAATKDFGQLGGYFSIVPRDADDDRAEAEIPFTPPKAGSKEAKAVTEAGSLVRFYFVVRDQRGGVDFTTRSLCIVPELAPQLAPAAPAKDP